MTYKYVIHTIKNEECDFMSYTHVTAYKYGKNSEKKKKLNGGYIKVSNFRSLTKCRSLELCSKNSEIKPILKFTLNSSNSKF